MRPNPILDRVARAHSARTLTKEAWLEAYREYGAQLPPDEDEAMEALYLYAEPAWIEEVAGPLDDDQDGPLVTYTG